jgi:hypothetical protein
MCCKLFVLAAAVAAVVEAMAVVMLVKRGVPEEDA